MTLLPNWVYLPKNIMLYLYDKGKAFVTDHIPMVITLLVLVILPLVGIGHKFSMEDLRNNIAEIFSGLALIISIVLVLLSPRRRGSRRGWRRVRHTYDRDSTGR